MARELRRPYRQTQDLQVLPDETVRRDRKQLPECVHLSSLKGTLRFGGAVVGGGARGGRPYAGKVLRKPPKRSFQKLNML